MFIHCYGVGGGPKYSKQFYLYHNVYHMDTQYFDVNPMQIFWDVCGANEVFSRASLVLVISERPFFKSNATCLDHPWIGTGNNRKNMSKGALLKARVIVSFPALHQFSLKKNFKTKAIFESDPSSSQWRHLDQIWQPCSLRRNRTPEDGRAKAHCQSCETLQLSCQCHRVTSASDFDGCFLFLAFVATVS